MAPSVSKFPISGGNNTAATWNSVIEEILLVDFTASGLTPTDGGLLVLNVAAGVAYCAGVRHNIGSGTATMGKSTTNYVFYDPATLDYHVDTDNTAPANSVKIATVVCGATTITSILDTRRLSPYPLSEFSQPARSGSVVYQNTSSSALFATLTYNGLGRLRAYIGTTNLPTTEVANLRQTASASELGSMSFIVPSKYYYKVTIEDLGGSFGFWSEWI